MIEVTMRTPELDTFTKTMLKEYRFPGADAAVVFVKDGQAPSPKVAEVLRRSGQQRWLPVLGGHNAKIPWHVTKGNESLFVHEKNGWDHDQCDFCSRHIYVGDQSWTASFERRLWILCGKCYKAVKEP